MGLVHTEIKLINGKDLKMVRQSLKDRDEVRHVNVYALVDSGACMLTINEHIQEILQLPFVRKRTGCTADGRVVECDVVGPVQVEWEDSFCECNALVMPGDSEPLLGAMPMEEMDLIILPKEQKLIGRHHPDHPVHGI